jgi:hypothetical protein
MSGHCTSPLTLSGLSPNDRAEAAAQPVKGCETPLAFASRLTMSGPSMRPLADFDVAANHHENHGEKIDEET